MRGIAGPPVLVALPALALLALAGAAAAQPSPPGVHVIGVYRGDFSGPTSTHFEGTGQVTLHLILSGLERPECGVAGWGLSLVLDGFGDAVTLVGAALQGQGAINLYESPDFLVGLAPPYLQPGPFGTCLLATLDWMVTSTAPTYLRITANRQSPIETWAPEFFTGCDLGEVLTLHPSSGSPSLPVFGFNTGPLTIPADGRTWGEVKGLYR